MKLTEAQWKTLAAITKASDEIGGYEGIGGGFVFGPYGRSGHSLVERKLLERKSALEVPGTLGAWPWGFRPTIAGRAALAERK